MRTVNLVSENGTLLKTVSGIEPITDPVMLEKAKKLFADLQSDRDTSGLQDTRRLISESSQD